MMMKTIAAAGFLGLAALSASPASAQVARFDPALNNAPLAAEQIQWRGGSGFRGNRGGYYGRPAYRGGYYGGGYYRRGPGPGAIIGGLAAGAIIGGAIASQARPVYGVTDPVSYCVQRFRSYDPASGTYLGYDGQRHACP
jgi:hypothetical protein